jgi:predicted Zn-dependent peptidase
MNRLKTFAVILVAFISFATVSVAADTPYALNLDVKEFFLQNGMQFLVVERHTVPQVACRVAIRAGSALEETGKTGIAHMLEHMMFKGTKNFGTLDWKRDQELQQEIEAAYQVVLREELKRNPDHALIRDKVQEMERLRLEVQKLYVPQAFSMQVGMNGAVNVNAFTSTDQTQYLMSVPSDMIEQWFSIVSEQIFEPAWREFYVEREVIKREWAFRYINNPDGAAWLDLMATSYDAHPYRNPVIGWKSDIDLFSETAASAFHREYYNPTDAVCVLVGDITLERAKALAAVYFERYPAGPRSPERVTEEPAQQGPRKSIRFLKGARDPVVYIGFHGDRMGTNDFYALEALGMILSHGRGARLTQEVVNKGLAVEAWAYNPDNRYGTILVLGGSPKEPEENDKRGLSDKEKGEGYVKSCEAFEAIMLAEADKLKHEPVSEQELNRVKKLAYRGLIDRLRSNESLAGTLATMEVQVGWKYLLGYMDNLTRVTTGDIQRVAAKYFQSEKRTSVYVVPGGAYEQPPEPYVEVRSVSAAAAVETEKPKDLENHSIYPTPVGWKHPLSFHRKPEKVQYQKAERFSVGNATVFYLADRELPIIDLTILVKAGAVDVAPQKEGLAGILSASLVRSGTESLPPKEFGLFLDENAIRLSVSVNEEETSIELSVLKEDWEKGVKVLTELLTKPRLDPEIIRVMKESSLTALKRQGGDAEAVSSREAMIWHFKGHPYGRDPLEGLNTIPNLTREDLLDFLKAYFVPSNMVVCASGDIDRASVERTLVGLIGSLPDRTAPERHIGEPAKTPPVIALINKPGQVQSQVNIVLPSERRTQPDFWDISLLVSLFGGNDSLLYTRLRDNLGLVYAAYFYQTYKWQAGLLKGYIGCKADKTAEAIDETATIMKSLSADVPSSALERRRLDVLNSFVFNVDTPSALVEAYGRYLMRKEPLDTLERIQDAYLHAKREALEKLAKQFLDPDNLQVFVVADKTIEVKKEDGTKMTLEQDLKDLARKLEIPFVEIPLR